MPVVHAVGSVSDTGPVPYTLSMGLLWFALAFVIGLVTGILVRSVVARRQIAAARDGAEIRRLQRRIDELEEERRHGQADPVTPPADSAPAGPGVGGQGDVSTSPPPSAEDAAVPTEPAGDDLTRIEGLGPAVRELFDGVGIGTFEALADAEVATLRSMLDDAGARYQVYDPTTWPAQARLLSEGRHEEFEALVESIRRDGPSGPVAP